MPRPAHIVAIHYSISTRSGAESSVESVVLSYTNLSALADTATPEKHGGNRACFTFVEQRVEWLCDFFGTLPTVTSVRTSNDGYAIGIFASRCRVSVYCIACHANYDGLVTVTVSYDGCIPISARLAPFDPIALGH